MKHLIELIASLTWKQRIVAGVVALILIFAIFNGTQARSQEWTSPRSAEWTTAEMNAHIDQTNFIVGNHCSATLISITERLLLTNHHCVDQYIKTRTRQVVGDEGQVTDVKYEYFDDVPVSQKVYAGHRVVSQLSYSTVIVNYSEPLDLAVVQFRAPTIPNTIASTIHTGDMPMRGDTVYAVGNPLGLDATLTKGVMSSVSRRIQVGREERDYFQMDAGIAGGNSGGALYNVVGDLIGVPAAGAQGTMIGLAIPYTDIQEFLTDSCYAVVFDAAAPGHDECVAEESEE